MREISFSIPVSGVISIGENSVTITVNAAKTTVKFEPVIRAGERASLGPGRNLFDIVLETARKVAGNEGENRFSAAELFHQAVGSYPGLKRNSWTSHVIASAPNHTSYQHYGSKRDYFRYMGEGTYQLNLKYLTSSDRNNKEV
jgi:hypothetical protein